MNAVIEDSHLILRFEEALTSTTVHRLRMQYLQTLEESAGITAITADISHVSMIDSQGLNFIIGIFNDSKTRNFVFKLTGASQANRKLFALVNLQDHIPIG
ncbi:MAG TPA: STAS domain-containing protein [Opitutales bacterium]|nr:STAS domain-containing protein [Opitutales bacterium]